MSLEKKVSESWMRVEALLTVNCMLKYPRPIPSSATLPPKNGRPYRPLAKRAYFLQEPTLYHVCFGEVNIFVALPLLTSMTHDVERRLHCLESKPSTGSAFTASV